MSKDGDLTGPDSPPESSREPDEFDSLILDDAFIAGGIREASLTDAQRAVRPPETVEQVWARKHAPRNPPPPGSPTWTPRNSGRDMRSTGLLLGTAAVVVLLVVMTGFLHIGPGLGSAVGVATVLPSATETAATTDAARPLAIGLSAMTPIGTCFGLRMPSRYVVVQPCSQPHEYELTNMELASGRSDAYPATSYWTGTVDAQCDRELQAYLGSPSANRPATVKAASFGPSRASWAAGDRTVYCVAQSTPASTGSLYRLGDGSGTPTN